MGIGGDGDVEVGGGTAEASEGDEEEVVMFAGTGMALKKDLNPSFALFLKSLPSCFSSEVAPPFGCDGVALDDGVALEVVEFETGGVLVCV